MLLMPVSAYPISVELNANLKIRSFHDGEMDRTGYLKRGSIIEIPDEFAVYNRNKKLNFELTLNNWLRTQSSFTKVQRKDNGVGLYKFDGESYDYFFPIKIKKIADGSTYVGNGEKEIYMGLKYLSRRGRKLIVNSDAPVIPAEKLREEFDKIAGKNNEQSRKTDTKIAEGKPTSRVQEVKRHGVQVQAPVVSNRTYSTLPTRSRKNKVSEANTNTYTPKKQDSASGITYSVSYIGAGGKAPEGMDPGTWERMKKWRAAQIKKSAEPVKNKAPEIKSYHQTEAVDVSYCESCRKSGPIERLLANLPASLKRVDRAVKKNLERDDMLEEEVADRFKSSCGISWYDFKKEIYRETGNDREMVVLMRRLMMQESSARCQIVNSEADRTSSKGLFQINSETGRYGRCSQSDKNALKKASIETMKTKYQCIENPIVNLREAVWVLKGKERYLKSAGFDLDQMTKKDRQRLIFSAYNGGEHWVETAKKDLETFNSKQGTNLNYNNWEDLRLFYLRRALNYKEQKQHFGSYISWVKGKRNRKLQRRGLVPAISNLAYVEAVIPREDDRVVASN